MPHIRKDPVTKQSVIIASDRTGRPSDYITVKDDKRISNTELNCPFCKGHENITPNASIAFLTIIQIGLLESCQINIL